jgi:hypothetical protein
MNSSIKGVMFAAIGGVITYVVVQAVIDAMITGTTAADNLITGIVPILLAAAVVIAIIVNAFKD